MRITQLSAVFTVIVFIIIILGAGSCGAPPDVSPDASCDEEKYWKPVPILLNNQWRVIWRGVSDSPKKLCAVVTNDEDMAVALLDVTSETTTRILLTKVSTSYLCVTMDDTIYSDMFVESRRYELRVTSYTEPEIIFTL